jgi:hypothetical protein
MKCQANNKSLVVSNRERVVSKIRIREPHTPDLIFEETNIPELTSEESDLVALNDPEALQIWNDNHSRWL